MESARWERLQSLFERASLLPEPVRTAFLQADCGLDRDVFLEVSAMIDADIQRESIIDQGLTRLASQLIGHGGLGSSLNQIGPYRLVRLIGEGGMGVVWLAERIDAGNRVAIKFLPHAGLSPARRDRFTGEIKTLAKLNHPFIARLYDAGSLSDGTPWFVMEYVDGVHFTDYCRQRTASVEERLGLFRKVCQAVQYAHGQEIIHRDLKPSNIMVEADGTPKLLDFGIARQLQYADDLPERTRPGLRFMSLQYAAPEWVRDGIVGPYTDVYSLGVVLGEILTGEPLPRAARKDLDELCSKATLHDAALRYQSVEALIRDIDHYLNGEPLEARPDNRLYRLRKFVRGIVLLFSWLLSRSP